MSRPSSDRRLMLYLPNLDGGGAEGVMVTLANGLAALGYHVDLVAATTGGVNEQNVSGGVNLVHLGASGCLASVPSLIRCLRKTRPQAIISTLSHANLAAIISNRLAGGNRRVIIRESAAIKLKSQYYGSLRTRLTQTGMRWLYPQASFVVANSPGPCRRTDRKPKGPASQGQGDRKPGNRGRFSGLGRGDIGRPLVSRPPDSRCPWRRPADGRKGFRDPHPRL